MGNEQDSEFKGLEALVTGASSGIGAETAIAFGSLGAHVLRFRRLHFNGANSTLRKKTSAPSD